MQGYTDVLNPTRFSCDSQGGCVAFSHPFQIDFSKMDSCLGIMRTHPLAAERVVSNDFSIARFLLCR
jgi:hypothetical protein